MQANGGDPDQTPCLTAASDLGLHYLPMSQKKDAKHTRDVIKVLILVWYLCNHQCNMPENSTK